MAIAKGTAVRQVLPAPVEGTVVGYNVDGESGAIQYLVQWQTAEGDTQERFFSDGEIEAV